MCCDSAVSKVSAGRTRTFFQYPRRLAFLGSTFRSDVGSDDDAESSLDSSGASSVGGAIVVKIRLGRKTNHVNGELLIGF